MHKENLPLPYIAPESAIAAELATHGAIGKVAMPGRVRVELDGAHPSADSNEVSVASTEQLLPTPLTVEERDALLPQKWWENTAIQAELDGSLYEAFQVHLKGEAGDLASMDILNCSPIPLSQDDVNAVRETVGSVSDYTQGKIFSRVKGIIFSSGDKFENGNLGGYAPKGNYLRINIDELRKADGDTLAPRYARYFKGKPEIGTFEVNLAHELGHSVDVHDESEARASGLDIDEVWNPGAAGLMQNVSAFHGNVGWKHSIQSHESGLMGKVDNWKIDDAAMTERREYPPTTYGATDPPEDFADSFAITSLGGDTSTMPVRVGVLKETVDAAAGAVYPQASGVSINRLGA